jgi:hypothetical protein
LLCHPNLEELTINQRKNELTKLGYIETNSNDAFAKFSNNNDEKIIFSKKYHNEREVPASFANELFIKPKEATLTFSFSTKDRDCFKDIINPAYPDYLWKYQHFSEVTAGCFRVLLSSISKNVNTTTSDVIVIETVEIHPSLDYNISGFLATADYDRSIISTPYRQDFLSMPIGLL